MARLQRSQATWLIYVQLSLFTYFLYGFGPIVAVLRDEQGVSHAMASLHSTALAVGAVPAGAAFAFLSQRFGRPRLMWGCLAGLALGILAFVVLPAAYPITLALTVLVSFFGISIVNGVVVSLTQLHGTAGPAAISEANAMAVGSGMIAPLIIGLSIGVGLGWRGGLAVLIGLIAIVALVAWRWRIVVPAPQDSLPVQEKRSPLGKAYWLVWTMLVATGAIEMVLSLWSAVVLEERTAMSTAAASAGVSAIVGGMMLGRAGGAWLALRVPLIPLYFGALAISLAGFTVFWLAQHPVLAIAGLLVTGIGNGMHYPLAIGVALSLAPSQPDRAAGVVAYGMAVSFGAAPFAFGLIADQIGAHSALVLVPGFIALAAVLAWWLRASMSAPQLRDRPVEIVEQAA